MRLLSHVHINGNGSNAMPLNAHKVGQVAQEKGYTHTVLGCHEGFICPSLLMVEIEKLFGIKPIRFAELSLKARGETKYDHSHIKIVNIPEQKIDGFIYGCNIEDVIPYIKKVGAKVVLCHPESLSEIEEFEPFIDGFEIVNGLDGDRDNSGRLEAADKFPHLQLFKGADFHTWEDRGNTDYFTELPDNYFGEIYS